MTQVTAVQCLGLNLQIALRRQHIGSAAECLICQNCDEASRPATAGRSTMASC